MLDKITGPTAPTYRFTKKMIGVLIWLVFAAGGTGALYACSKLAGD